MKKIFLFLFLFITSQLCADWVIGTTPFEPGENDDKCPNGGVIVTFSDPEQTPEWNAALPKAYVCNGEDGENGCEMLVVPAPNSPSAGCLTITSGVDCDGDKAIDKGKETSETICNGGNGSDGSASQIAAESAADGAAGAAGADGKAAELVISTEPEGENCVYGGTKIENRFDSDGSGTYEEAEISVKYVCNGEDGKTPESPKGDPGVPGDKGEKGEKGDKGETGEKGETGDAGIQGEAGKDGTDGHDTLMSVVDEAAGYNCRNGGKKFMSGADANGNGVLDEDEIKNSYYICNGVDAVEASESVKESGCSAILVDTDPIYSISSMISAIYDFVSDLF